MKGQKCRWVGTGWCVTKSEIGGLESVYQKVLSGGGVQEVE